MGCAVSVVIFLVLAFFASISATFTEGNPYGLVFAGIIGYILYLIFKPSESGSSSSSSNSYRPTSGGSSESYDPLEFMIIDELTDHWDCDDDVDGDDYDNNDNDDYDDDYF